MEPNFFDPGWQEQSIIMGSLADSRGEQLKRGIQQSRMHDIRGDLQFLTWTDDAYGIARTDVQASNAFESGTIVKSSGMHSLIELVGIERCSDSIP